MFSIMSHELSAFIIENLSTLQQSGEYPLLNTTHLSIPPSAGPDISMENGAIRSIPELNTYPKFKHITGNDVAKLRLVMALDPTNSALVDWKNKLLRYVEINLPKLQRNEKQYGRYRGETISIFTQALALFVESYIHEKDLLYLNTALKVFDLTWAKPQSDSSISTQVLYRLKEAQINQILKKLGDE